jgi:hypothetical protein
MTLGTLALLHLLAPWASAESAPRAAACPDRPTATVELGDENAPLRLHAFFDPSAAGANAIWTELRRIVAERDGELAASVWLVRPLATFDPRMDRVRRFAWAAARLDRLGEALLVVARLGADHVAASLLDEARIRALAPSLRVEGDVLVKALADDCDDERLDLASAHVLGIGRRATLGLVRLPGFALGGFVFDDTASLDRVRPELSREPVRRTLRWRAATMPPTGPAPASRPTRARVPTTAGVVLGGIGLPHRLVVVAQGEDDPSLFLSLPRAMQFRTEKPGQLTVQIVARGAGFGANVLRGRLCAAGRLGRELEYVRLLAGSPDARRDPDATQSELLAALDREADAQCGDEPNELELTEGAWLDGVPRSATELEDLPGLLRQSAATRRVLDLFLHAPATDT